MQKNTSRHVCFKIAAVVAVVLAVITIAHSVSAAQNSNFPSPSQCNGAAWNIGTPDGVTCSGSVASTAGAMEQDSKATSIFGSPSRLKPDLNSLNQFCKQYTGDSTSYATYGAMHNYCTGCDQNLSWWTGSSWVTNTACAGTLNVQNVKCATGCNSTQITLKSSDAPDTVYLGDTFQIKCNFGPVNIPCITGIHDTPGNCSIANYDGTTATFDCTAKNLGLKSNYCNLFVYPQDNRCNAAQTNQIKSTNVISKCTSHSSKKCVGNDVYWYDSCGKQEELAQSCGSNQTCSNGQCVNSCTNHFSKKCVGNNVYWYDSCGNKQELLQNCTSNQTCSYGECLNIACNSNSDCGTDGFVGGPFCKNGDVYKTYKTYTCSNPGSANSHCLNSQSDQLITNCSADQSCSNGQCSQNPNDLIASCYSTPNPAKTDQTVSFIASATGGTGSYAYSWSGACTGSGQVCADIFSQTGTFNAILNVTSGNKSTSALCSVVVNQNCSSHYSKRCLGNDVYWYDSCGNQEGIFQDCTTSNQTCSDGQCHDMNIACNSNSDCGTNGFIGSPFCKNGDVYKTYKTYTCSNPGSANSHCSNSQSDQLITNCTGNQTCSDGQCHNLNIACSSNSDCGNSGFVGNPFCQSGDVYQNYKTFTCNNPGSANAACSNSTEAQLKHTCSANQTCNNGSCQNLSIACSSNSDCGTNAFTGSPFCQSGNVYQNFTTYTCNNPGTANAVCVNSTSSQLKSNCSGFQTCYNGQCSSVACNSNSDCGTNGFTGSPFCQSGDVYQNFTTYTCNNPGAANSSCSSSSNAQLKNNCNGNQECSNGSCHSVNIACSSNSDCGTNGYIGDAFCSNGDVYRSYRTYTCNNAGTANSSCSNSQSNQLVTNCTGNQTCSNGSCSNVNNCTYHSYQQCNGNNLYWYDSCGSIQDSAQYCPNGCFGNSCGQQNNYVSVQTNSATNINNNQATLNGYVYGYNNYNNNYYNNNTYVWFQWGNSTSYGYETPHQNMGYNGLFSQNVNLYNNYNYSSYHFRAVAQSNNGQISYGQDMTFYTSGSNINLLTVSKTVRNMTSANQNWSNTAYANPSDTLMFMITIQTTGNQDVHNVLVRDTLANNLIYKNQLVVSSGYNNYNNNYNYSGDITSGINLGIVPAGQTITITYQAQVAGASNFSYGTTTLTNNVSVQSSESGYNPTSDANVIVTRTAVYGASTVSTGLTNNIWVDSFILPLLLSLIGILLFRSGAFFGIEKWTDNLKKKARSYRTQKELNSRIAKIRKLEGV